MRLRARFRHILNCLFRLLRVPHRFLANSINEPKGGHHGEQQNQRRRMNVGNRDIRPAESGKHLNVSGFENNGVKHRTCAMLSSAIGRSKASLLNERARWCRRCVSHFPPRSEVTSRSRRICDHQHGNSKPSRVYRIQRSLRSVLLQESVASPFIAERAFVCVYGVAAAFVLFCSVRTYRFLSSDSGRINAM